MVIEQNQVEKYFDYSDSWTIVYLYNWVATETLATKLTYNCYFSRYNCYRFILQIWVLPGWVVYVYHGQCLFTVAPCETSCHDAVMNIFWIIAISRKQHLL